MKLSELIIELKLDSQGFDKGVKQAESSAQSMGGKVSAMTVAVGQMVAEMAMKAAEALKGVFSSAIDGYAQYEQLVGGVETLFKTSSDKVLKYANNAYKTAGVSANKYMELATSFSASLLQGLGGDTEAAADLANLAIEDMSDNANKMGTDLSSIQSAYQGFAKNNFTMLDNLKLGYGGTAGEMVRLVNESGVLDHEISSIDEITFDNIISAIHAVQEKLGMTGTTAKEAAETLEGSKNAMKSAWEDLLTSLGTGDESYVNEKMKGFTDSFQTYVNNLVPTVISVLQNGDTLIEGVADAISGVSSEALTSLANAGFDTMTGLVNGANTLVNWLINGITDTMSGLAQDTSSVKNFGKSIGLFISQTFVNIATNIGEFIEGLGTVTIAIAEGLIEGIIEGFTGSGQKIADKLEEELNSDLADIEVTNVKTESILSYLQELISTYGEGASNTEQWAIAVSELEKYMPGVSSQLGLQEQSSEKIWENYKAQHQALIESNPEAQKIVKEMDKMMKDSGDSATNTQAWKDAVAALNLILPDTVGDMAGISSTSDAIWKNFKKQNEELLAANPQAAEIVKSMDEMYADSGGAATYTEQWQAYMKLLDGMLPGAAQELSGMSKSTNDIYQDFLKQNEELINGNDKAKNIADELQRMLDTGDSNITKTHEWKEKFDELKEALPDLDFTGTLQGNIDKVSEIKDELRKLAIQNALNKASESLYDAWGEQVKERELARFDLGDAQKGQQNILNQLTEMMRTYSKTLYESYEAAGVANQYGDDLIEKMNIQSWEDLGMPIEGFIMELGRLTDDLKQNPYTPEGTVMPWDKSLEDNLLPPDQINKLLNEYNNYGDAINESKEKIDAINKEIEAIELQMTKVETAIKNTAAEYEKKGKQAASSVSGAGDRLANAINGVANKVNKGSVNGGNYYVHDTGLFEVPFDGYKAELHRGERVLTRAEAREYNRGGGYFNYAVFGSMLGEAFDDAFNRVNIYLGADKVGNLTTNRVNRNIKAESNARLRGMGG